MTKPARKCCIALLILAISIPLLWPGDKEPEYGGKSLSEWLLYADDIKPIPSTTDDFDDIAGPRAKEAAVAVRAMSSAAVPLLLRWFEYKPGALRTNVCWAAWKLRLSPKMHQNRIYQKLIFGEGLIHASLVPAGFRMLGPTAAPAVPRLGEIMEQDADLLRRRQAMVILMSLGDAGLPPLLRAMTNQANPDRQIILFSIGAPHRESVSTTSAIPALVQCLADPQMENAALTRLKDLAVQPDIVIPALTNALAGVSPKPQQVINSNLLAGPLLTQVHIIHALAAYESRATSAVPSLLPLLQSPLPTLRYETTNALRKIAPEVLSAVAKRAPP